MLKSSGRRIDISQPFVDAMLPEGHRLHVVLEGISRGFSAVNIRKFVLKAGRLCGPGRARQPDARARRRSSRRRSGPGSTSWSPAARRPARPRCSTAWPRRSPAASGWSAPRRSSSCGSRTPTGCRCRPASPGSRAPARSGCATWSRRACGCGRAGSSSARCAPRSASTCCSPSTPGCPACAPSTPTAPARRWSRCARCRCSPGENISARFVVPTVAASVDLVVHLGIDAHGVRRVNEIVAVPGPGRERRHRDRADLRPRRRRAACGPAGCRRGRALRAGRDRRAAAPGRGALMGALVGLGVGVGLLLVWSAFFLPAPAAPTGAAGRPRDPAARRARVSAACPRPASSRCAWCSRWSRRCWSRSSRARRRWRSPSA